MATETSIQSIYDKALAKGQSALAANESRVTQLLSQFQKDSASSINNVADSRLADIQANFISQNNLATSREQRVQQLRDLQNNFYAQFGSTLNPQALKFLQDQSNIPAPTLTSILAGYELARASKADMEKSRIDGVLTQMKLQTDIDQARAALQDKTANERYAATSTASTQNQAVDKTVLQANVEQANKAATLEATNAANQAATEAKMAEQQARDAADLARTNATVAGHIAAAKITAGASAVKNTSQYFKGANGTIKNLTPGSGAGNQQPATPAAGGATTAPAATGYTGAKQSFDVNGNPIQPVAQHTAPTTAQPAAQPQANVAPPSQKLIDAIFTENNGQIPEQGIQVAGYDKKGNALYLVGGNYMNNNGEIVAENYVTKAQPAAPAQPAAQPTVPATQGEVIQPAPITAVNPVTDQPVIAATGEQVPAATVTPPPAVVIAPATTPAPTTTPAPVASPTTTPASPLKAVVSEKQKKEGRSFLDRFNADTISAREFNANLDEYNQQQTSEFSSTVPAEPRTVPHVGYYKLQQDLKSNGLDKYGYATSSPQDLEKQLPGLFSGDLNQDQYSQVLSQLDPNNPSTQAALKQYAPAGVTDQNELNKYLIELQQKALLLQQNQNQGGNQ